MTDFASAFSKGQRAVDQAETARKEIASIFKTMFDQLSSVTVGRLELQLVEWRNPLVGLMLFSQLPDPSAPKKDVEQWICARNAHVKDHQFRRIAKWAQSFDGYPCTLSYAGQEVRCHDGKALESALAHFLQNAWVGEQLRAVLELDSQQSVEGDSGSEGTTIGSGNS